MRASRFTTAFQLISLALIFSLAQVYVIATPTKANTDPKAGDNSSASQPKAEAAALASVGETVSASTAPSAVGERMPLTAGTKTMLTRLFSRSNVESRIAASNTFLKAKTSAGEMFKGPRKAMAPQTSDDSDDGGSHSTWVAVGVIAAVLTIAIIGLRHDRNEGN